MGWVVNILGFLLVIGVLVAVHEFGHFWVARRVGVRVLRFSIGFGRPLLQRTGADGTEYVIAAIPLGGYVKMLDEREGPVDPAHQGQAFNNKPLWARNAVIAAGPVFNFALAIVAYWAVFVIGATELRPVLGEILPDTPAAAAGFQEGDELQAIAGSDIQAWDEAVLTLLRAADDPPIPVVVERADGSRTQRSLDLSEERLLDDQGEVLEKIGFQPWRPRIDAVIDEVVADGAAAGAGMESGDRVVAIEGESIERWGELVEQVRAYPNETVNLVVERDGSRRELTAELQARGEGEDQIGLLGVTPQVPEGMFEDMRHQVGYGPLAAIPKATEASWRAGALTVEVLGSMVIGQASVKNLSGPINIAQYAGDSVSLGITPFLKFLAIVSISLGILNLLPVPILDGGHLLYNTIEWVRGRPLSEAAQGVGQQIGLALLFMLMALAFYNDLHRLFVTGG